MVAQLQKLRTSANCNCQDRATSFGERFELAWLGKLFTLFYVGGMRPALGLHLELQISRFKALRHALVTSVFLLGGIYQVVASDADVTFFKEFLSNPRRVKHIKFWNHFSPNFTGDFGNTNKFALYEAIWSPHVHRLDYYWLPDGLSLDVTDPFAVLIQRTNDYWLLNKESIQFWHDTGTERRDASGSLWPTFEGLYVGANRVLNLGVSPQVLESLAWNGNEMTASQGTNIIRGTLSISADGHPETLRLFLNERREYIIAYTYEGAAPQKLLPSRFNVYGVRTSKTSTNTAERVLYEMHGIVDYIQLASEEPAQEVLRADDLVLHGRQFYVYTNDGRYLLHTNGSMEPVGIIYSSMSTLNKRKVFLGIMLFLALAAPVLWLLLKRVESRKCQTTTTTTTTTK